MARPMSVLVNIGAKVGSSLNAAATATERRFKQMGQAARLANAESRAMMRGMRQDASTFASHVSMPAAALAGVGARAAYEWSKVGNELQAVTQMSDVARKRIEQVARSMPGNPAENLKAALDLARTGFDEKAIMGSLGVTIKLGKSDSSVDQAEAADIMTNVMKGMKMPDKTFKEVSDSANRVANNIAYAAAKSSTDVRLMGESFKYAAPMAARMGIDIETLSAFFMTMANNGIKGSEAGVAFRSGLVRMIKPTKGAMGVLARYNMDLADYVKANKKASAADIVATLKAQGIAADGAAASIQALINNPSLTGSALIQKISEAVAGGMGGGADAMDLDKISDGVMMAMTAGVTKVDFAKFIQDGVGKGWGAAEFANFFDVRQGTRLSTLWSEDAMKNIQAVRDAMERASRGQASFLDKMYLTQMQGAVGPWEKMKQGFSNVIISMAESGAMDTIANGMNSLANGMMALSKSSPGLLKFITFTLFGLAILAPLGFALAGAAAGFRLLAGGLGLVGGPIGKLIMRLLPLRLVMVRARYGVLGLASEVVKSFALMPLHAGRGVLKALPRLKAALARMAGLTALASAAPAAGAGAAGAGAAGAGAAGVGTGAAGAAGAAAGGGLLARLKAPFLAFGPWLSRLTGGWGGVLVRGLMAAVAPIAGVLAAITAPMWAVFAGVALGIGLIIAKWNGIKAFFAGFREGLAKAITPETRAAFAGLWSAIKSLGIVFTPVIAVAQVFWGVLKTVGGWIARVFGPAEGEKWRGWGAAAGSAIGGVVNVIGSLITKIGNAIQRFKDLFNSAKNLPVVQGAMRGFASGGLIGGVTGAASGLGRSLAGARAKGGPVRPGLPYLVGERGPEIVVPGASGTVIPNHRLASLGAPRHDIASPATMAFRAIMPKLDLAAIGAPPVREPAVAPAPVPNPLAASPRPEMGTAPASPDGGALSRSSDRGPVVIVKGASIVIHDARDPAATAREVRRELERLANRQAALLSD